MVSLIAPDIPDDAIPKIDCKQALEILDQKNWQTDPHSAELTNHLLTCEACAFAVRLEETLREVIAPTVLPTVSSGFEMRLMSELGIKPRSAKISSLYISPVSRWGWAAALLTIAVLLSNQLVYISKAISAIGLMIYAKAAALFAGKTALAFSTYFGFVPKIVGSGDTLAMNFAFAIIILAGAITAVRWSVDR